MDDLYGYWQRIPETPSAIVTLCVICGAVLGGVVCWFGAEGMDFLFLKVLIALAGAAAGGGIGLLVGVILAAAAVGAVIGLLLGGVAYVCGHFLFAYDSWLLVIVPGAAGAGVGAILGVSLLIGETSRWSPGVRALCLLGFVTLLGISGFFVKGGVENVRRFVQEQRNREARQAEQEKQEVRNKLEAAVAEQVSVPESLAANAEGKQAYETWHRAARLLQEYHGLARAWKTLAGLDENEDCTVEKLSALADSTSEPDVKNTLTSIRDALITGRREEKEEIEQANKQASATNPLGRPLWMELGSASRRDAREKELQDQADDCMTRLSQRYGFDFRRMHVWKKVTPPPGSEAEAMSRRLIGSWEGNITFNQVLLSGVQTYWPDGRFLFTGTITRDGQASAVSWGGVWRIEEKKLHTRLLQTSGPVASQPGAVDADEIITLTDDEKTIRDVLGNVETYRKVK
jgi:hypothetical protein